MKAVAGYLGSKQGLQPIAAKHTACKRHQESTWHDVIKWKPFPRYWPFVRGIHRSPVNSPHKGQWRGALMFSLICVWINGWVNNGEAGDLKRCRAHYDVIVMGLLRSLRMCSGRPISSRCDVILSVMESQITSISSSCHHDGCRFSNTKQAASSFHENSILTELSPRACVEWIKFSPLLKPSWVVCAKAFEVIKVLNVD